jgi:hypothetical protein
MADPTPIRVLDLRGPTVREEAVAVFRALMVIAFGALFLIGRGWTDGSGAAPAAQADAPAYQVLFRDLTSPEQRMFRGLQEGLTEAENLRPGLPEWPSPEALASQGIPPFAPDPLAPGMTWSFSRRGPNATYLGATAAAGSPAYLILIQEPAPDSPGDPPNTPLDETHHRLSTGVILHVSIWEQPAGRVEASPAILDRPYLGGWRQIEVAPMQILPASPAK